MARTKYGKTFRTRRGRIGRYKYVNGRRVSFVSIRGRRYPIHWRRKGGKTRTYFRRRY